MKRSLKWDWKLRELETWGRSRIALKRTEGPGKERGGKVQTETCTLK